RGVETDVADVSSESYRHAKGLNGTIEVLVIDTVLIVPNAIRRIGDLVAHKPNTVIPRIWFDLIYHPASPRHDSGLFPDGGTCCSKAKRLVNSEYVVLTV